MTLVNTDTSSSTEGRSTRGMALYFTFYYYYYNRGKKRKAYIKT